VLRKLTFARVVSIVAIFVALGAGAYAADLKKNSVKAKQIKDGAVATKDIKAGAVTGAKLADGAITGAKVIDGSIGGVDIDEATLAGLTAAEAETVNGVEVKKVDFQSGIANGVVRSILLYPNVFRIDAQCASGGDQLDITAFTAVDNSRFSMVATAANAASDTDTVQDLRSFADFDFDTTEAVGIDNQSFNQVGGNQISLRFMTPTGFSLQADLYTRLVSGNRCIVVGTAVAR
jgi:hypothetical protein